MQSDLKSFLKAVSAGTIAAGVIFPLSPLLHMLWDVGPVNVAAHFFVCIFILFCSLTLNVVGSVVVGLPTAAILGRGTERLTSYLLIGATAGFLIPFALWRLGDMAPFANPPALSVAMGLLGTLSGAVTALTWCWATRRRTG